MKITLTLFLLAITTLVYCQEVDTLTFYSEAFQEERTVYVYKPEFNKYRSEWVKLPVIYLLDGQHEWFINPILSDIRYLQYAHEIPQALVVVIPHKDRNKECIFSDLETEIPLDKFITQELDQELVKYNPNEFKIIMGHSFSASFSLYSFYNHPKYYTHVIAHTPLNQMDLLVERLQDNEAIQKHRISISIGGIAPGKDAFHRKNYNRLKDQYPQLFSEFNLFEANFSTHNAVPISSTPTLLTQVFESFKSRYNHIALVDENYKLTESPEFSEQEASKINEASIIGDSYYTPEIAELNGIASRYWNNDYEDHAAMVYKLGLSYYPNYYDFYLSLYNLTFNQNQSEAKSYLLKAEELLKTVESDWDGKQDLINEIEIEKTNNGWN